MDEEIAEIVQQYGWYAASVSDHEPPFLYTIGLMHTCGHPEFIVFGLGPNDAYALCAQLVQNVRAGQSYASPGISTIDIGDQQHRVGFRTVHPTQQPLYLGFAMGFLMRIGRMEELAAVQAFWPDSAGRFPFDANCDQAVYNLQPRLDIGLTHREIRAWERQWE